LLIPLEMADLFSVAQAAHFMQFKKLKGKVDGRPRELNIGVHEDGGALVPPLKDKGRICGMSRRLIPPYLHCERCAVPEQLYDVAI
uniref:Polyprotein n=1 Tax=Toxocara canis TaxID=6265 RepID=A0A183U2I5_TOXCA